MVSPCATGARYFFRRGPKGGTVRVVCPRYKWERRQKRATKLAEYRAERKGVKARGEAAVTRARAKGKLWKVAPVGAVVGIAGIGARLAGVKAPKRYIAAKALYTQFRTGKYYRVIRGAGGRRIRQLARVAKPMRRVRAIFKILRRFR